MQIIPAIDLLDSKCVRLIKGDYSQVTIYNNNPLDQIKLFEDHGIKKVHIVDLDSAKSGHNSPNTQLIKNIASSTNIEIQVGGGIRSIDKAQQLYDIGISKIIIGTAGIESANFLTDLLTIFKSEFIVAGLDFNIKNKIPFLATNGWTKSTSINIYTFLESLPELKNILATDISVDGTMEGPNICIYKKILDTHGVIFEFGVRWGQTLSILSALRGILEPFNRHRKIVGFDTFTGFKGMSDKDGDKCKTTDGSFSVSTGHKTFLDNLLNANDSLNPISHLKKYELVEGDAKNTIPEYLKKHPETVVSMAILDFDIYEPTKIALEAIKPHLMKGSILVFDQLCDDIFPGETIAVQEVLGLNNLRVKRMPMTSRISYAVID